MLGYMQDDKYMWTISEFKEKAKYILTKCCYWKAVLVGFIFILVGGLSSGGGSSAGFAAGSFSSITFEGADPAVTAIFVGIFLAVFAVILTFVFVFTAFVTNPIVVGCNRFFCMACISDTDVGEIGFAFNNDRYMNIVKAMFSVFIEVFLWSLLLVIPGIVKGYEYRMVPYILSEHPFMSGAQAKELSREMMNGEKMNAFIMDISFIGWYILSACTCGILMIFWTAPYVCLTNAQLYLALKNKIVSINPY